MIAKKLGVAILSLMMMVQIAQARNNAALFGVAAAAIAGAAIIANSNREPRRDYYYDEGHRKKIHKKKPVVVMTEEMKIQKSLTNLDFYKGKIDGKLNSYTTRNAIKNLNKQYEISDSTTLETKTWDQLLYLYELFEVDQYLFMDATTKISKGKQLQAALKAYGVYSGEIDGVVGGGTKSSIAEYKSAQGLEATTILSSSEKYNLIEGAKKINSNAIDEAVKDLRQTTQTQIETNIQQNKEEENRYTPPSNIRRSDTTPKEILRQPMGGLMSNRAATTANDEETDIKDSSTSQNDTNEMQHALDLINKK